MLWTILRTSHFTTVVDCIYLNQRKQTRSWKKQATGLSWKTTYLEKLVVYLRSLLSTAHWEGELSLQRVGNVDSNSRSVSTINEFVLLFNIVVLETLFNFPKTDWRKDRKPAGQMQCSALHRVRDAITTLKTLCEDYNMCVPPAINISIWLDFWTHYELKLQWKLRGKGHNCVVISPRLKKIITQNKKNVISQCSVMQGA